MERRIKVSAGRISHIIGEITVLYFAILKTFMYSKSRLKFSIFFVKVVICFRRRLTVRIGFLAKFYFSDFLRRRRHLCTSAAVVPLVVVLLRYRLWFK